MNFSQLLEQEYRRLNESFYDDYKKVDYEQILIDADNGDLPRELDSTILGTFLGYSIDSIIEFAERGNEIERLLQQGYNFDYIDKMLPIDQRFDGTGFVPSRKEQDQHEDDIVRNLNFRRFFRYPFINDANNQRGEQYMIDESRYELKNNESFQKRVYKNFLRVIRHFNLNYDIPFKKDIK